MMSRLIRMKIVNLFLIAGFVLSAVSEAQAPAEETVACPCTIIGTILTEETEIPAEGLTVHLLEFDGIPVNVEIGDDDPVNVTDSDGRFELELGGMNLDLLDIMYASYFLEVYEGELLRIRILFSVSEMLASVDIDTATIELQPFLIP